MIPSDSNNIIEEYEVLLKELKLYNPELLDKEKMLAITKCDLLDEELTQEIKKELPADIKTIFISSIFSKFPFKNKFPVGSASFVLKTKYAEVGISKV